MFQKILQGGSGGGSSEKKEGILYWSDEESIIEKFDLYGSATKDDWGNEIYIPNTSSLSMIQTKEPIEKGNFTKLHALIKNTKVVSSNKVGVNLRICANKGSDDSIKYTHASGNVGVWQEVILDLTSVTATSFYVTVTTFKRTDISGYVTRIWLD